MIDERGLEMTKTIELPRSLSHRDRFLIGGVRVEPSVLLDEAPADYRVPAAE
jgi:hypothetical protein